MSYDLQISGYADWEEYYEKKRDKFISNLSIKQLEIYKEIALKDYQGMVRIEKDFSIEWQSFQYEMDCRKKALLKI